ncbi:MAG: hypothetical protein HYS80_00505 [Candidatus Aenigmarchaeota archaeon]|nr:hypothetical protein [Candidatus Aenigmarchaeota archaeon]
MEPHTYSVGSRIDVTHLSGCRLHGTLSFVDGDNIFGVECRLNQISHNVWTDPNIDIEVSRANGYNSPHDVYRLWVPIVRIRQNTELAKDSVTVYE